MIRSNLNDGDLLRYEDIKSLKGDGFIIDENRDFTNVISDEADVQSDKKYRLNFVGFTTNNKGDLKTVFPKSYKWEDTTLFNDRKKIFRTIIKHIQKNPSMYIGSEFEKNISTNYPFSAFYSIYEYYKKYGIHFKEQLRLKPYGSGKVNWKETIRLSEKYFVNYKLIMLPIYHNEKRRTDTFIANCMIYAIDYTIDKFNSLIDKEKTNRPFPEFDYLSHKGFVMETLTSIKSTTYSDITIKLIDNLIAYFSVFESSGKFYLKHYSFANIWEDMVMEYLRSHYLKFEDEKLVLSEKEILVKKNFTKPTFYPNLADSSKFFQPDHYLVDGFNQLILDAKYYDPINMEMDYKQISYLLFLKNKREKLYDNPLFDKTYSALIIPSTERSSKEHFRMNPLFNKECEDFIISEERLNIKEVIDFWIKN